MEKRPGASTPAFGGTSLLVIFSVLCLAVFAVLCLSSVQAETRLTEASANAVRAYYEADRQAEEIYAKVRAGEISAPGDVYEYSCPISESQTLFVKLGASENGWTVLRWQAVAKEIAAEDSAPNLWNGENLS